MLKRGSGDGVFHNIYVGCDNRVMGGSFDAVTGRDLMADLNDFSDDSTHNTNNCVTCRYKAINGIEWPCMVCVQNVKHENAKDMWEG